MVASLVQHFMDATDRDDLRLSGRSKIIKKYGFIPRISHLIPVSVDDELSWTFLDDRDI